MKELAVKVLLGVEGIADIGYYLRGGKKFGSSLAVIG